MKKKEKNVNINKKDLTVYYDTFWYHSSNNTTPNQRI